MSFIKFQCQSLKWARFGTFADLDCYVHQSSCFDLIKVEPRRFGCHAYIGFLVLDIINLIGLFIPLLLSKGSFFKSLGKALLCNSYGQKARTYLHSSYLRCQLLGAERRLIVNV